MPPLSVLAACFASVLTSRTLFRFPSIFVARCIREFFCVNGGGVLPPSRARLPGTPLYCGFRYCYRLVFVAGGVGIPRGAHVRPKRRPCPLPVFVTKVFAGFFLLEVVAFARPANPSHDRPGRLPLLPPIAVTTRICELVFYWGIGGQFCAHPFRYRPHRLPFLPSASSYCRFFSLMGCEELVSHPARGRLERPRFTPFAFVMVRTFGFRFRCWNGTFARPQHVRRNPRTPTRSPIIAKRELGPRFADAVSNRA